ncbi:hypothetical protein [Polaromonas sp. SM01]|uniref:hypothetical protein n=1 Tax=Polaromonas sp. SM01 TaxID=3085630 RepID=UPI002982880D|nr:hypothetical protein [Polaromonas sp. SM01]MDW5443213.1 hypothetical protein [Polaromonas sp. SM01]
MLKEVGASGQISLGKKFAGRLFDVIVHPDERFELIPMKAVPASRAPESRPVAVADGWLPPGGYGQCTQWALDNRVALEAYAQRIAEDGTAAEQLQRYLAGHPDALQG